MKAFLLLAVFTVALVGPDVMRLISSRRLRVNRLVVALVIAALVWALSVL